MYIQPNSNLHLLHNVPLDTSYEHTIYFANATAQYTYFNSLAKVRKAQYSYLRPNSNVIRVGELADNIYDCNYIMFQNQAFGNKWFYAYITAINYVNNVTSEIEFEIDVMQTWLFDFELEYCLVERTHTQTDVIGEHIEPEKVACGEYVMNSYGSLYNTSTLGFIVAITNASSGANGNIYDGIYGGATLWGVSSAYASARQKLNEVINDLIQKPDAVTSIYTVPWDFVPDASSIVDGGVVHENSSPVSYDDNLGTANAVPTIDGYSPKNNKLFTYPYCFYHVDNGKGSELALRYEFFADNQVQIKLYGTVTQPVQVALYPVNYKGSNGVYRSESVIASDFPMCSWNYDAYKAWVAQNAIPIGVNTIVQAGKSLGSVITGNIGGGITSMVDYAADLLIQDYNASIASDICKGSQNNGGVATASSNNGLFGGKCTITAEYAKRIDDYFTVFGYAVGRVMKPTYTARPHWTYIKTVDANIVGSVPCDDMQRIVNIFNTGVTFWRNGSEVGNYSLDNRPTSP